MVDCGKDIFDVGQIYVALSRITSSDNLKIVSFNSSKLRPSIDAWNEYIRLGSNSVPSNTSSFNPRPSRKCSVNDIDYVGSRKSTDVMQIIEDPLAVETPCTGTFENKNSVVCYANSTVQCLLNIIPFSSIKDLSELGNISVRHKKCMISSLSALRKEIGHGFHLEERHDPAEFFYYLMGAPAYATLKPSFEIQFNERYQCSNPKCNVVVSDHTYPKVVYDIQATSINRSVQQLLDLSLQSTPEAERLCNVCQVPIIHHQSIISTSDYFVVKITPVHENGSFAKRVTKVKQIPTSNVRIRNQVYKFKCMVSHCGNSNPEDAHYIAWVKMNKRWYSISDERIDGHQQWPQNGWEDVNKKSPYLLFYSR